MKTSLSTKGQIVLPAEIRRQDKLRAGQQFEIERVQNGEYVLRKVDDTEPFDVAEWLLNCPVKGWFKRPPGGSTDEIRPLE